MAAQKYSEDDKAVALSYYAATGNNLAKTAKDCKIPKQTLHYWVQGGGVNKAVSESSDIKKGDMADYCEAIAWKLLTSLEDEQAITDASLGQRSTAFGTIVDKMRLLRGESTQTLDVNDQRTAVHEKWAALTAAASAKEVS